MIKLLLLYLKIKFNNTRKKIVYIMVRLRLMVKVWTFPFTCKGSSTMILNYDTFSFLLVFMYNFLSHLFVSWLMTEIHFSFWSEFIFLLGQTFLVWFLGQTHEGNFNPNSNIGLNVCKPTIFWVSCGHFKGPGSICPLKLPPFHARTKYTLKVWPKKKGKNTEVSFRGLYIYWN